MMTAREKKRLLWAATGSRLRPHIPRPPLAGNKSYDLNRSQIELAAKQKNVRREQKQQSEQS